MSRTIIDLELDVLPLSKKAAPSPRPKTIIPSTPTLKQGTLSSMLKTELKRNNSLSIQQKAQQTELKTKMATVFTSTPPPTSSPAKSKAMFQVINKKDTSTAANNNNKKQNSKKAKKSCTLHE